MIIEENATVSESVDFDELQDMALENAVQVEAAYGDMMLEAARNEFAMYKETGKIDAVNEGAIDSIKAWIKKAWENLKRIFSRVVAKIRGWIGNSKTFYNKYAKEIEAGASKVADFKGYTYRGLGKISEGIKGIYSDVMSDMADGKTAGLDDKGAEKKILSSLGAKFKGGDFAKSVKDAGRGSDEKKKIKIPIDTIKDDLVNGKEIMTQLKSSFNAAQAAFNMAENGLDDDDKEASKSITGARVAVSKINAVCNITTSLFAERLSQSKAYASAAVQASKKAGSKTEDNKSTNESAEDIENWLQENGLTD